MAEEEGREKEGGHVEEPHCWDLNPDCGVGGRTCRPHCPAYRGRVDCWAMDWDEVTSHLAAEQRQIWRSWFKNRCPRCPVFMMFRKR